MARVETKKKELKKPMSKKAKVLWISIPSAIAFVGLVVGLVFLIINLNKKEEETTYTDPFATAQKITYKEFNQRLDDGEKCSIDLDTIYVLVYSSNTDSYTMSQAVIDKVNACINKFATADTTSSATCPYGFYVLNTYLEDNTAMLSKTIDTTNFETTVGSKGQVNKDLLSSTSYATNGVTLVKIEGSKIVWASVYKAVTYADLQDCLNDCLEDLKTNPVKAE